MARDVRTPKKFDDYLDCEPEYLEEDFLVFEDFMAVIEKRRQPQDPRTDAEFLLAEFHIFEKFKKDEYRLQWREDKRQRERQRQGRWKKLKRSSSPVSEHIFCFLFKTVTIPNDSLFVSINWCCLCKK